MARRDRDEDEDRDSKKRFKYRGYDQDAVKKAAKAQSGDYDNYLTVPGFKPKEGENNIRILPRSWDDTDTYGSHWGIEIKVHYRLGNEESTYLCLRSFDAKAACPACDAASEADNEKESKALRAKKRVVAYIIDRSDEKAGPQPWSMPFSLYKKLNARIDKVSTKIGEIKVDHPDDGYDVSFNRVGTDEHTQYDGEDVERDSTPLSESAKRAAKWLAYLDENPLPDVLQFYDEDHLEKVLSGGGKKRKDDDDDDDDDDKPKAKKAKGKKSDDDDEDDTPARRKPKGKKSDDDDEDDDNEGNDESEKDDDDDDDDDDKPKSKKAKGKSKKSSDDDDEDDDSEDDDDEDDDDKPKSKKGKSKSKKSDDDDEEEEVELDDDDDDDKPKAKKGKGKKSDDDDEDDDNEDDSDSDEDDDEPKKGGGASSRAKKKLENLKRRRGGR